MARTRRSLPMRRARRRQPIHIAVTRASGLLHKPHLAQQLHDQAASSARHSHRPEQSSTASSPRFPAMPTTPCPRSGWSRMDGIVLERDREAGECRFGQPQIATCEQGDNQLMHPLTRHSKQRGQFRPIPVVEQSQQTNHPWAWHRSHHRRRTASADSGSDHDLRRFPGWRKMPGVVAVGSGKPHGRQAP